MIIEGGTDAAVVGAFHPPLGENTFQNTTICILLEIQQGSASSKEWCCSISETSETSPIFWQMSNNYNFSLFMLGDKGVSILNIEY